MAKDNLSKVVNDRLKAVESVQSALTEVSGKLASGAQALFGPHLKKGEELPNFALIADLTKRVLRVRADEMAAADAAHNAELADDAEPRERRDAAVQTLYGNLARIKEQVGILFGPAWVQKLGFPARLPQDPLLLRRTAEQVEKALSKAKLPKPDIEGVGEIKKAPFLAKLTGPGAELDAAFKDVSREAREAQTTLIAKTRAVEAFDDHYAKGLSLSVALLRLVGEDEHADRLRPTARRTGPQEETESEEESSSEGDAAPVNADAGSAAPDIVAPPAKSPAKPAKKKTSRGKKR